MDPLLTEYLHDPDFIADFTSIRMSPECSELVQDILKVDPLQRVTLAQMRSAIENMDTFLMEPSIECPLSTLSSPTRSSSGGSSFMQIALAGVSPPVATPSLVEHAIDQRSD